MKPGSDTKTRSKRSPARFSNESTDLDPILTGLNWDDGFSFGSGINAVQGTLSGNAVKPFTVTPVTLHRTVESIEMISDEGEFNQEVEVAASGKYNMEGVAVNASTKFLSTFQISTLAVTLTARFESINIGYEEAKEYSLTDNAQKLIGDPNAFRTAYGDYFIAGSLNGARFRAVYVCVATSEKSMTEFKASIGADVPDVFSAEGSTRFQQAISKSGVQLSVVVEMTSPKGTCPVGEPWSPAKVVQALDWFKQNFESVPLKAKLLHYSTIVPTYSRTVPIAPQTFVELSSLYEKVWDLRARFNSIPPVYQDQYQDAFHKLDVGVPANQDVLANDKKLRDQYQDDTSALLLELQKVIDRQTFYGQVKQRIQDEPAQGKEISSGYTHSWLYGFKDYTSSAVSINSYSATYADSWHIGHREKTLEWSPGVTHLIVGWEVVSNWNDDTNGVWKKDTKQILLTSYSAVHVKSEYDRGCNWTVIVYWVPAADYQFGDTTQITPGVKDVKESPRSFTWSADPTLQEAVYQAVEDRGLVEVRGLAASDWDQVFKETKLEPAEVLPIWNPVQIIKAAAPILTRLSPLSLAFVSIFAIAAYKDYTVEFTRLSGFFTFRLGPAKKNSSTSTSTSTDETRALK